MKSSTYEVPVRAHSILKRFGRLLIAFSFCLSAWGEAERPNIILVFVDDMGWGDLSCFGNEDAQTPQIDRIASEGIRFEHFYVNASICSPSRVAISTGQYPQRWRITSYLDNHEHNSKRGMADWLDPAAPTLAKHLQNAGYLTGHFGKWHMGGQRDVVEAPPISDYGFDQSLTNFEGMGAKLLPLTARPDGTESRIWGSARILGGPVVWMQRSEITTGYTEAALAFIRQADLAGKPFYINLWPDDVHSPFFPPVDTWGDGSKRARYLAVLEEMDRQLGLLFDYIRDDEKLRNNTLILLCSDNGPENGAGEAGPFKGAKGVIYEGGIRSPLIVWGPRWISESSNGSRNTSSVLAAIDLAPSLCDFAQVGEYSVSADGENVLNTLLGKSDHSRTAPLFFGRPSGIRESKRFGDLPDIAVRDGQWKLLCDVDGSHLQLYDLYADPGESENLAEAHPDVAERLSGAAVSWYQSVTPPGAGFSESK